MLPSAAASEPGHWSTARTEYLREIMDAPEQTIVVVAATQVGKSECLLNLIGHRINDDPGPMLFVLPDLRTAEAMSKERLQTMINATPVLHQRVREAKSRDSANTIYEKAFDGGYIALVGANSPAGLAMRPVRYLFCDEVDKYAASAGVEGNPIELAIRRQQTFWNYRTVITSSPTLEDLSEIWRRYQNSDQRKFYVPCPDCGHEQVLVWSGVKWDKTPGGEHLPDTARYMCEDCGVLWDNTERNDAVSAGRWVPTKPTCGIAGFHIPGFLSPWIKLENVVRQFLDARHDSELLKTWTNTVLAEVWAEQAVRFNTTSLIDRREAYTPESLPDDIRLITAGVDVQGDRLEMQVIGWGENEEAWAIDYLILHGDPGLEDSWVPLDMALRDTYKTESGRTLNIRAVCIDSGHTTAMVYKFCAKRRNRRVFATKGRAGPLPIWPKWSANAKKRTKDNSDVFILGVDTAKSTIHARLAIAKPTGSNAFIHFPVSSAFDATYFAQLAAEVVITKYKMGRAYRVWQQLPNRANEALDTLVLALAARESIPKSVGDVGYLRNLDPPGGLNKPLPSVEIPGAEVIAATASDRPASPARPEPKPFIRIGGRSSFMGR